MSDFTRKPARILRCELDADEPEVIDLGQWRQEQRALDEARERQEEIIARAQREEEIRRSNHRALAEAQKALESSPDTRPFWMRAFDVLLGWTGSNPKDTR